MATVAAEAPVNHRIVPDSFAQVTKLARYQLREYLRSLRFVALVAIVIAIGAIFTFVVSHYRSMVISNSLSFYQGFWGGGIIFVIVLAAVFFGGDAIAGEFQNKTGYFLMGLPVRRPTIYAGKFIAAFLASVAIMLIYLGFLLVNGFYYFGTSALPWQLFASLGLAVLYLAAVLGTTFMFSALFKTSAYGFVLTAILFLFGFMILQELIAGLVMIEPWMVITYANSIVRDVFASNVNWGFTATKPDPSIPATFSAGIGEGILIMLGYFVATAAAGLFLFEREEFN